MALLRRPWISETEVRKTSKNKANLNVLRLTALQFICFVKINSRYDIVKQMIWYFRFTFFFRTISCARFENVFSLEVHRESRRRSAVSFPALTYHANATRLTHCADDSCWHFVIVTTSRIFSVTLRMACGRTGQL